MPFNRSLGTAFKGMGKDYDAVRPDYPSRLISHVLRQAKLKPGAQILDIGCGTGRATAHFVGKGYHVLGIDPSAKMLAIARKKLPDAHFWKGRFEDFPETKKFDSIIAAQAFHWIDPEVSYPKAYRLLKEDGILAIFWNAPDFGKSKPKFLTLFKRKCSFYPYSKAGISFEERPLRKFGRLSYRKASYRKTFRYSLDGFLAMISTFSWIASLPREKRESLFKEIAQLAGNQDIILPRTAHLIIAKKKP
ncbi:MAG: class I SAM-dependent methyltransferase [Nanoarchaeota archaeon]